jgi:hypothetical protein
LFFILFLNIFNSIFVFYSNYGFFFFGFKTNIIFLSIFNLFNFNKNESLIISKNFFFLYSSKYFSNTNSTFNIKYSNEENYDSFRYLKFYNPIFKYNHKSGNYFSKNQEILYRYLFTTIKDISTSIKTTP